MSYNRNVVNDGDIIRMNSSIDYLCRIELIGGKFRFRENYNDGGFVSNRGNGTLISICNDLHASGIGWEFVRNENMENNNVIKFDNREYVWEEVEGKGKCLVPYVKKDLFDGIKLHVGQRWLHSTKESKVTWKNVVACIDELYCMVEYECNQPNGVSIGKVVAGLKSDSLEGLAKLFNNSYDTSYHTFEIIL